MKYLNDLTNTTCSGISTIKNQPNQNTLSQSNQFFYKKSQTPNPLDPLLIYLLVVVEDPCNHESDGKSRDLVGWFRARYLTSHEFDIIPIQEERIDCRLSGRHTTNVAR